jgi:hypothetical protein
MAGYHVSAGTMSAGSGAAGDSVDEDDGVEWTGECAAEDPRAGTGAGKGV